MISPNETFAPLHKNETHDHTNHVPVAAHAHLPATSGRVTINDGVHRPQHGLHNSAGYTAASAAPTPVRHIDSIQTQSVLSTAFFSEANQTILQNAIRYNVWKNTSQIIGKQNSVQLQIIMRSIFLQFARHSVGVPIRDQVAQLNDRVLNYCLPEVISNVKQYMHYTEDVSQLPMPFDHAVNVSQKGSKTLSTHPFV